MIRKLFKLTGLIARRLTPRPIRSAVRWLKSPTPTGITTVWPGGADPLTRWRWRQYLKQEGASLWRRMVADAAPLHQWRIHGQHEVDDLREEHGRCLGSAFLFADVACCPRCGWFSAIGNEPRITNDEKTTDSSGVLYTK